MAVMVETKELLETVVASLVAGVGVTVVFSVAIRNDRPLAAGAAAILAGLAVLFTLAAVVFGIVIMSSK